MDVQTPCRVITAASIARTLQSDVVKDIAELNRVPKLVGFLANSDPGARTYAEWTGKTFVKHGIHFELREVDKDILVSSIVRANSDPDVDGIMVYYPVFNGLKDQQIKQTISRSKDVEGLNSSFIHNLFEAPTRSRNYILEPILPTTPLAMVEILKSLKIYTSGPIGGKLNRRNVTIVNRSEVVGKPLAALLAHEGACVYSVDVTGIQIFRQHREAKQRLEIVETGMTLEDCLSVSDTVISGVPGEAFKVPVQSLRDGCVCLNFSSEKNFDQTVKTKASIFVPSIGPVTIAVLMRNLLYLIKNKQIQPKQHLEQKPHHVGRHWILKYFGISSLLPAQSWGRRRPWIEYAICLVGVSVGVLSFLN